MMSSCEDPGRLARDAYTYLHVPIVAGIIAVGVGDELLIGQISALALSATVAALLSALWELRAPAHGVLLAHLQQQPEGTS